MNAPEMPSGPRDVRNLGQVFTPPEIVEFMLGLCRNTGRALEPAAGDGAFFKRLRATRPEVVGIEVDARVAPPGALVQDFFAYPEHERFASIVGNPPYVRYQDIPAATRALLPMRLFDRRSNLFLFFIEKCVRHLEPGGELVFIVPREFIKLTAAHKLNAWLYQVGSITDFHETGDRRIFDDHLPNCAIFRFEKGRCDRRLHDGRTFCETGGQLLFLADDYTLPLAELFEVRVGAVSGADDIFTHPEGNLEFVCSKTAATGATRRMLYGIRHPHLEAHKERLLARRVQTFDERNWWLWGRAHPIDDRRPRIYVNARTRRTRPFFLHDSPHFDGAILALFPRRPDIGRRQLAQLTELLNTAVNWQELGFVCDGRYLFTQRSLQNCRLPARVFAPFLAKELRLS